MNKKQVNNFFTVNDTEFKKCHWLDKSNSSVCKLLFAIQFRIHCCVFALINIVNPARQTNSRTFFAFKIFVKQFKEFQSAKDFIPPNRTMKKMFVRNFFYKFPTEMNGDFIKMT